MSEQRFEKWNDYSCKVKDNQENTLLDWEDVVNKLNEQQDTISELQKKLSECQGHKLELTPIPISNSITLKEAEDSIRITKYEELFDDE